MDFWDQLLRLDFSGAPRCAWERLGEGFRLIEPALVPAGRLAKRLSCPKCGCNHLLIPEDDEAFFRAVCQCDAQTCGDFRLPKAQIELWQLNVRKLPNLLGEHLPMEPRLFPAGYSQFKAWKLGAINLRTAGRAGSLVACFSAKDHDLNNAALGTSQHDLGPIIFVCRTERAEQLEAILPPDSLVVDFASMWQVTHEGLQASKSARRILSGWDEDIEQPPARVEGADYLYRKRGAVWEVVFEGGQLFHVKDSLGARYIDYLLHHPNEPIPSFDLEVAISPEKSSARGDTSIQANADGTAVKSILRDLARLRAEREEAMEDGDHGAVAKLDDEIEALESGLRGAEAVMAGDKGEKARNNVRNAIKAVRTKLLKGSKEEKRFGKHLADMLSTGHDCSYKSAAGRIWQ